jgi:hypothetical protein
MGATLALEIPFNFSGLYRSSEAENQRVGNVGKDLKGDDSGINSNVMRTVRNFRPFGNVGAEFKGVFLSPFFRFLLHFLFCDDVSTADGYGLYHM